MEGDTLLFLLTVAVFFAVGLPAIVRKITLPRELNFWEVADSDLTAIQVEFFARYDETLKALGFAKTANYRLSSLKGANISRLYQRGAGSGLAIVAALTSAGRRGTPADYLEFIQWFAEGTRLTTRNVKVSSLFERLPNDPVETFPGLSEPAVLLARHERAIGLMGKPLESVLSKEEIFQRAARRHRESCELQTQRGLLRFDPKAGLYRATYRLGLRGIVNFLNPFSDNFTGPKLLLAVAAGAGLPFGAAFWPGLALPLYAAGGFALGALFDAKAFIWGFLIAFADTRLLAHGSLDPMVLSLAMAGGAEAAARLKRRRERVA